MLRWIPYAVVRMVVFFIAGILLGIYLPDFLPEKSLVILFLILLVCYVIRFVLQQVYKRPFFNPGFLGLLIIFLAGYLHLINSTDARRKDNLINLQTPVEFYEAAIISNAQSKERSWKAEATVRCVKTKDGWEKYRGNIVLYFPKTDFKKPYQYGDILLVKGNPQIVPAPGNPGEFDYKRFLAFRKVYYQQFVRQNDVKYIASNPSSVIIYYAIKARIWADTTLTKFVTGEREQAIASALVLGVTDGLDNDLLNAYAATGAMHVLAVSGLHISIIYMIILWLLHPLGKSKSGRLIQAILSLVVLWGYAFITGLSPSVLRAVTMFTFIVVAKTWNRQTNIYNILASSALCLLAYEPYMIMSVAFQLSYLAVLGIVYLQPGLYNLWEPNSRLLDEVWKITSVSIAAQLATLSLGLLYFHQFPNYFLLSNLLVIPGSFLVLVIGLLVLVVSFINPLASFLGLLLQWTIQALNIVVFTVEAFPFSLVDNIYINTFQSWMLMGVITGGVLLFQYRKFPYLVSAFACAILFVVGQWNHFYEDVEGRGIAIYKVPHHSAMDLIDHGQAYFFTDSVLIKNASSIRFHIHPNRLQHGVAIVNAIDPGIAQGYRSFTWHGKSILQILNGNTIPMGMTVDYLFVSNNAVRNLSSLASIHASQIILDSSNSYYFAGRLLDQAAKLNINLYSVWHEGAFVKMI